MQRTAVIGLVTAALVLLTLPIVGTQKPAREARGEEPWRVSWEERMTRRFSAFEQERRLNAYLERRSQVHGHQDVTPWPEDWHVIEGATDAAALTPNELFDELVATAFAEEPVHRRFWRTAYELRIDDEALRDSIWMRLAQAISPYLEIEEKSDRMRSRLAATPTDEHAQILATAPDSLTVCRVKAEALAAARREFGHETFDRVLYGAIAPSMTVSSRMNQAQLESIERGCR